MIARSPADRRIAAHPSGTATRLHRLDHGGHVQPGWTLTCQSERRAMSTISLVVEHVPGYSTWPETVFAVRRPWRCRLDRGGFI